MPIHLRFRDVYVKTVAPSYKHVVIVIDNSFLLSEQQLLVAKSLSKLAISSLSGSDQVCFTGCYFYLTVLYHCP